MHRDGRFNPLEVIAEILALTAVLGTAAVHWWRHGTKPLPPIDAEAAASYYRWLTEGRNITGPGPYVP